MAFTGDIIHGWRIAKLKDGRRPMHGTGFAAWVDEPVVELVKGQRHIRAKGQQGIDPEIVLDRAIASALTDDIRDAQERQAMEEVVRLTGELARHERLMKIRQSGWAARRVMGKAARMTICPASGNGS